MSKKEKIVPITSAATENEQSKIVNKSIAEKQQKINFFGTGEMALQLKAPTSFPKVLSSIPSNNTVAHNHL